MTKKHVIISFKIFLYFAIVSFTSVKAIAQPNKALVIYIHGGGFIQGDKSEVYSIIDTSIFNNAGIKLETINHPFVDSNIHLDNVINYTDSLVDYLMAYNNSSKESTIIIGRSSGASLAIVLSSKVNGVGLINPQSTLNKDIWDEIIPAEQPLIDSLLGPDYIYKIYGGVDPSNFHYSLKCGAYIKCTYPDTTITNIAILTHHPNHCYYLMSYPYRNMYNPDMAIEEWVVGRLR